MTYNKVHSEKYPNQAIPLCPHIHNAIHSHTICLITAICYTKCLTGGEIMQAMCTNKLVTVSNTLTKVNWRCSLLEQRILHVLLGSIRNKVTHSETGNVFELEKLSEEEVCYINLMDMVLLYDMTLNEVLAELTLQVKPLFSNTIIVPYEGNFIPTRWVTDVMIDTNACLHYKWGKAIIPYISELKSNFTTYKLNYLKKLDSVYAIQLYLYCLSALSKSRRTSTEIIPLTDELRVVLGTGDKYKQHSHLRESILEPAIQQINERTNITIEVAECRRDKGTIRHGRKIVAVIWNVRWKEKKRKVIVAPQYN
jgi:plasmid replication initiation protein